MQNLFDQAPCLYFSSADDGTLLEVNDCLCAVLQYHRNELTGKKSEIIFTIATRIFQQTHFFPLLKMQGHAEEIYITLKRKDGEQVPVLINAERKMVGDTAVSMHVGIIVYNRKKFEEELIAAKKEAQNALHENTALIHARQQLQKRSEELDRQISLVNKQNNELNQFSRVVTHDMQEPLRKLSLFSGMLIEGHGEKEQRRLVERIKKVSDQMHSILSGLQQYVWLNDAPLDIERISFNILLSSVVKKLEAEFPGVRLEIKTEIHEDFEGDTEQVQLLFYHLLSNAVRFRKGDEVFISIVLHKVQLNQFKNMEGRYKYVDHTKITITDKGIGFNPAYKTQLFELFKRLHNESGRGVGLAICKKITNNHHGSIAIDSKLNEGTTVTIYLPANVVSAENGFVTETEFKTPEKRGQ
ncbi:MAG: PAS domain-containing sensor histidine kinase [Flavisolibacter sp.]|nr:PAS domain-containing sensor histidine kinase [Flavisolibacter sp.]